MDGLSKLLHVFVWLTGRLNATSHIEPGDKRKSYCHVEREEESVLDGSEDNMDGLRVWMSARLCPANSPQTQINSIFYNYELVEVSHDGCRESFHL